MHTMTYFWYMMELKIGLAYVRALNFDQSFQQFNAKKKINAKKFLDLNAEYQKLVAETLM